MRLIEVLKNLARRIRRARGRTGMAGLSPAALAEMLRKIERTQEQEYACDEVLEVLDQFAEAVQRGEDAARLMPLVKQHLDLCPDCREEFEALLQVLRASLA